MKKPLLLFALLAIVAQSARAQDAPSADVGPKLRMAISGSASLGWFSPDGNPNEVTGDGVRFAGNYGLRMDFRLGSNPNYYFSTGLFMFQTGGTLAHAFTATPPGATAPVISQRVTDFRLNYVVVPVTFLLRTNEIGYNRYFARAGFDLGVNVKANGDVKDKIDATTISKEKESMSDYTSLFRTALHLEAGMEYNFTGNTSLAVSLEWNNGLNNVFNKDYRLPVQTANGPRLTGSRIRSITNVIALNVALYF